MIRLLEVGALPRNRRIVWRVGVGSILAATLFFFLATLQVQRNSFDAPSIMSRLESEGRTRPLAEWRVSLVACPQQGSCYEVGSTQVVTIPNPERIKSMLAQAETPPTKAILRHELSDAELQWLRGKRRFALVLPRSVQTLVQIRAGAHSEMSGGMGAQTAFLLESADVEESRSIELEFTLAGLPWFAPSELPIALVDMSSIGEYQSLTTKQSASSALAKQLQTGLPVLVCAMALLLDHSRAFGIMAVLSAVRAARSYLPFALEAAGGAKVGHFVAQGVLNGVSCYLLVLFAIEIAGIRLARRWHLIIAGGTILAFALGSAFTLDLWIIGDSLADAIASAAAAGALGWNLFKVVRRSERPAPTSETAEFAPGKLLISAKKILVLVAFIAYAYANSVDLHAHLSGQSAKTILDWRYALFYPALLFAAFLEIGSASRKIYAVAHEIAEKRLTDRELEMARKFQRRLLPERRRHAAEWEWRSWYIPASKVAGDWYDLREVRFATGDNLLAFVVADVTGHGVAAAMTTTIIASCWGQAWTHEAQRDAPKTDDERKALASGVVAGLHAGLAAGRESGTATAVVGLLDPKKGTLTICSCGHPFPLKISEGKVSSLTAPANGGLGGIPPDQWVATEHVITEGDIIVAFSDGLFPANESPGSWLRKMLRTREEATPISLEFLRKARKTKNFYRAARSEEDDITLVMIRPKKA